MAKNTSKINKNIEIHPAFSERNVPVVFAADNNYVNYVKVMLHSLISKSSYDNNYDLIFFNKDISEDNQNSLKSMIREHKNISIRFIDINGIIKGLDLRAKSYYSVEIYFRLFMPYILQNYKKAIYLDCDLILCDDVAKLFNIDIGENLIAAVRDIGMLLHYHTTGKEYIPKSYFEEQLMGINPDNYFNSGVIILNLEKFRNTYSQKGVITLVKKEKWHYPDQDVLNILCAGKTYHLESRWNTVPETTGNRTVSNILDSVPYEYAIDYINARNNPAIIHYALQEKPWKYTSAIDSLLYDKFWEVASKTDCFDELIINKGKVCGYTDAFETYKKFSECEIRFPKSLGNVWYSVNDIMLGSLGDAVLKYENAEIKNRILMLEGLLRIPGFIDLSKMSLFLRIDKDRFKCTTYLRESPKKFDNEITDVYVGFRCEINLDYAKNFNISLQVKYENTFVTIKKINYGKYFILDKIYKKQYYYTDGIVFTINGNKLNIQHCSRKEHAKKEIAYLKYLKNKNTTYDKKAIIMRVLYHILNMFKKKPIWIIGDNFIVDDNGIALFKYLNSKKDKTCKVYFVLSKENPNYREIKKMGNVVPFESKKYKWLVLFADFIINSVVDEKLRKPFLKENDAYRDILNKQKFIFLQHGVITQNLTKEHNKFVYMPKGFVVSALPEYNAMLTYDYFYNEKNVLLTGLPRFDYLYNDEKKFVTIMPTWRKALHSKHNENGVITEFKESSFYLFYSGLIKSERLNKCLKDNNYQLGLCLHPLLKKTVEMFRSESDNLVIFDGKYRDVFAWSNLIVSDYSSAIFDFLYLRKPIIYAHHDKEEFFSNHVYTQGYFDYERDGFGECEYTLEDTIDRVIEYVESDCRVKDKYRERMDNFFAFNDKNNCQRVYEAIINLEK